MGVWTPDRESRSRYVIAALLAIVVVAAHSIFAKGDGPDSPKPKKPAEIQAGKKKEKSTSFAKSPREKEFAKALGEDYRAKYTDHFFILTNADDTVVKDFIPRLEKTYDAVHRFLKQLELPVKYPKEKLPVLFCKDNDEFNARCKQFTGRPGPAEAAGLYYPDPQLNFSIFFDMSQVGFIKEKTELAARLRKEGAETKDRNTKRAKLREADWHVNRIAIYQQDQNRSVVQHELAHQLLFNLHYHKAGVANPQWFVEGSATLFEPPPGEMGAGINVVNQRRLGDVRDLLKTLKPDELRAFIGDPEGGGWNMLSHEGYARSWSLCYYLMKRKSKELPKYVALIRKRKEHGQIPPEQEIKDFESCFGPINASFVKKYKEFVAKLPYRP